MSVAQLCLFIFNSCVLAAPLLVGKDAEKEGLSLKDATLSFFMTVVIFFHELLLLVSSFCRYGTFTLDELIWQLLQLSDVLLPVHACT